MNKNGKLEGFGVIRSKLIQLQGLGVALSMRRQVEVFSKPQELMKKLGLLLNLLNGIISVSESKVIISNLGSMAS